MLPQRAALPHFLVLALTLTLVLILRFFNYRVVPNIPSLIGSLESWQSDFPYYWVVLLGPKSRVLLGPFRSRALLLLLLLLLLLSWNSDFLCFFPELVTIPHFLCFL